MQQIIKKFTPVHLAATILLAAVLFIGCNSGDSATEEKAAEPAPVENVTPTPAPDTLPTVDSGATTRPETIKN